MGQDQPDLTPGIGANAQLARANLDEVALGAAHPNVGELGDLAARGEPMTLSVVVQIEPTAVTFSTLTSTAVIHSTSAELETINNNAQGQTYIARLAYLPLIAR